MNQVKQTRFQSKISWLQYKLQNAIRWYFKRINIHKCLWCSCTSWTLQLTDEKPIDSLQLMMDAAGGKNGEHRKLTDAEITANAFVFILAG